MIIARLEKSTRNHISKSNQAQVSERWKENLLPQVPEQHLSYSSIAECSLQEKPRECTIQKRLILEDLHKLEKILRELFITRMRYIKETGKRVARLVMLQKFSAMTNPTVMGFGSIPRASPNFSITQRRTTHNLAQLPDGNDSRCILSIAQQPNSLFEFERSQNN